MFSLLSGFYRRCATSTVYNVLIVGLDNAGKTSFYEQVKRISTLDVNNPNATLNLPPPVTIPTVGLNVSKIQIRRGIFLQMWDLGGQSALRELWDSYTEEAHAIVFVIDSSDTTRFIECRTELLRLFDNQDILANAPLVIAVNKRDIEGSETPESILEILELPSKITDNRLVTTIPCVAKQAGGIPQIFEWLTNTIPESGRDEYIRDRMDRKLNTQTEGDIINTDGGDGGDDGDDGNITTIVSNNGSADVGISGGIPDRGSSNTTTSIIDNKSSNSNISKSQISNKSTSTTPNNSNTKSKLIGGDVPPQRDATTLPV